MLVGVGSPEEAGAQPGGKTRNTTLRRLLIGAVVYVAERYSSPKI